jgi:hypothetical protein
MAVRFDNSADLLKRTTGLPASAANQSVCLWAKRKVDTNSFATVFYTHGVIDNIELWLETSTGGDQLFMFDLLSTEFDLAGPTLTIDTWFFLAFSRQNTTRTLYYGTEADGTLTKVTDTQTHTASSALSELWIGQDIYTEGFNGEVAYVRFWSAALSDADMDAEWRSTTPVRATNLYGDWRLASAATATTDSSGNSNTLTSGGVLTDGGTNPTPPAAAGIYLPNRGQLTYVRM